MLDHVGEAVRAQQVQVFLLHRDFHHIHLDRGLDPFASAATTAADALVVAVLALGWVHQREPIKAWFQRAQMEAGMAPATAGEGRPVAARPPSATGRKPAPTKVTTSLPRKR